jgi:hypothetical protein
MVDGTANVTKLRSKLAVNNETRKDNGNGRPVNEDVVRMLRDALEMAETGEIVAAIITAVEKDGQVGSMVAGAEERAAISLSPGLCWGRKW